MIVERSKAQKDKARRLLAIPLCVFCSLLVLFFPTHVFAGTPMRIVYFEDYAPYSFKTGSTTKGIFIDIMNEVLVNRMGLQVIHESYPWARAQKMVKDGDADAFITFPTEPRLSYSYVSKTPVIKANLAVYASKKSLRYDSIQKINSISDLSQYYVCEYIGYGLSHLVPAKKKVRIRNLKLALMHLASGRCDAIVDDPAVIKHNIEQLELESFIKRTHILDQSIPFHLMISKMSKYRDILTDFDLNMAAFSGISQVHN